MATPGGLITPELLSPGLAATLEPMEGATRSRKRRKSLGAAVEELEREMIEEALERAAGNISETARTLGLTRRGLYLKMQRLGVSGARAGV
jgi:DNA-binding NtrC family response regulator